MTQCRFHTRIHGFRCELEEGHDGQCAVVPGFTTAPASMTREETVERARRDGLRSGVARIMTETVLAANVGRAVVMVGNTVVVEAYAQQNGGEQAMALENLAYKLACEVVELRLALVARSR